MRTVTLLYIELRCVEPFAVAAPEEAQGVDLPITRDAAGRVWVPPSSLAGSLRDHLRSHDLDVLAMGGEHGDDELVPSPLRFLGTETVLDGAPVTQERTSVLQRTAIDRWSGAAQARTLRSQQVAPPHTIVRLYLRYDGELPGEIQDSIVSWTPVVGGSRTRGMGSAVLEHVRIGTLDLDRPDDLRTWVLRGGPDLVRAVATRDLPLRPVAPRTLLDVEVEIVDGLLVGGGDPTEASSRDVDTAVWRRGGVPVIEGATLKGVLRSRTEWILRSCGHEVCHGGAGACGTCPVCDVFGSTERRGRLAVRPTTIEDHHEQVRPHVAIDRITGGARPHLLFTDEVVVTGRFRIRVDALDELPDWVEPVLRWVLRDLHEGYLGIGGRTTRGLGTVRLTDPDLVAGLPPVPPLPNRETAR
jgi:CRISPR/Cas system CSM-associated protein Csm3 (group 7 of RAMP superfamily)